MGKRFTPLCGDDTNLGGKGNGQRIKSHTQLRRHEAYCDDCRAIKQEREDAKLSVGERLLRELRKIETDVAWIEKAGIDQPSDVWNVTAPEAIRYRELVKAIWALPASDFTAAYYHGDGINTHDAPSKLGWLTRGRNKLIARVRLSGERIIKDGQTTFRFYDDAEVDGQRLFTKVA